MLQAGFNYSFDFVYAEEDEEPEDLSGTLLCDGGTESYRVRNIDLPENTIYEDTGCELAPSCLACPLAICKYDDPNWGPRSKLVMRNKEIARLFERGESVAAIAKQINVSSRTVYRVVMDELGPIRMQRAKERKTERVRDRSVAALG